MDKKMKLRNSTARSDGISCQYFHKQGIIAALVGKKFMRIIRMHTTKIKKGLISRNKIYTT